jgi:hypothetical protein
VNKLDESESPQSTCPQYSEAWVEGVNVHHNPNAKYPLDESFLLEAAHYRYEKGVFRSEIPNFHPYQSQTVIVSPKRLGNQQSPMALSRGEE